MNDLNLWIGILIIVITSVPLIKWAKEKRLSFYNFAIIGISLGLFVLTIKKAQSDANLETKNLKLKRADNMRIEQLLYETRNANKELSKINSTFNLVGLAIKPDSRKIIIIDTQKFKISFPITNFTNVTSINQKGGQTARDITNH